MPGQFALQAWLVRLPMTFRELDELQPVEHLDGMTACAIVVTNVAGCEHFADGRGLIGTLVSSA